MIMGIDISTYQNGINLNNAKDEGVKFVIIRGGFTGYANKSMAKDDRFEEHYKNAMDSGLDIGVYYFSRATSYEEGRKEAEFLYNNCLKDKVFTYPIYIDVEDTYYQQKVSKEKIDDAIRGFCEFIEEKNGYVGVYCNLNWADNHMNYDKLSLDYDFWLAYWGNEMPKRSTYGNYGVWQYGGETNYVRSNKIDNRVCDQNYSYKDYRNIMKSKNLNNFKEIVVDNNSNNNNDIDNNEIREPSFFKSIYIVFKKLIDYVFSKLKK